MPRKDGPETAEVVVEPTILKDGFEKWVIIGDRIRVRVETLDGQPDAAVARLAEMLLKVPEAERLGVRLKL